MKKFTEEQQKEKARKRSREYYRKNREYVLDREKKYVEKIRAEKPWIIIHASIKRRIKHGKHYKEYGIKNFLTQEDVRDLWFRDKACFMQMPSIDRKDGFGHYTKKNCRIIEYVDNLRRPRCWRKKENSIRNLKGYKK